jgi:hypothetical protein
MMNQSELIAEIKKRKTLSNPELFDLLSLAYPGSKVSTFYSKTKALIQKGVLYRDGRGHYLAAIKATFTYELSPEAAKVEKTVKSFALPFVIYEANLLDLWLNHLISSPVIFIEIERPYMEFVFDQLSRDNHSALLNPNSDELHHYQRNDRPTILVKPLIKEAPRKGDHILIEKLIVDLYSDRLLRSFFEGAELPEMYREIVRKYQVKMTQVYSYAKRKKIYPNFRDYFEASIID